MTVFGNIAGKPLTRREKAVLRHASHGRDRYKTAQRLHIKPESVKTNLERTYRKLGAVNKPHAVAIALREGLIR